MVNLHSGNAKHKLNKVIPFKKRRLSIGLSVFLCFALVVGLSPNLSFAADLFPETTEYVNVSTTQPQVISAPPCKSLDFSAVYEWQVYDQKTDDFITIAGETKSTLEVDSALISNALFDDNKALIKCNVLDNKYNVVNSKQYSISYESENITNKINTDIINADINSVKLNTLYSNNSIDEAANASVSLNVQFYDYYDPSHLLEISNSQDFALPSAYFDWQLEITTTSGEVSIDEDHKIIIDNNLITAEYNAKTEGSNANLYIKYDGHGSNFPEDVTRVNIKVPYKLGTATYYIQPAYQDVNDDETYTDYGNPVQFSASVGRYIPTETDVKKFTEDYYDPNTDGRDVKGWEVAYDDQQVLSNSGQFPISNPLPIKLKRTYVIVGFDIGEDGYGGPAKIYVKHGQNYTSVAGWENGHPSSNQLPKKNGYKFTGWKCSVDEQEFTPTESFGTVPGAVENPSGDDITYTALYELEGDSSDKVNVTIAYYCEKADGSGYEYTIERYDNTSYTLGDAYQNKQYELPQSDTPAEPKDDRRYPQKRSKSPGEAGFDPYDITSEYEIVEGVPSTLENNTFKDLYVFKEADKPVIKADGTTVCKVKLDRKKFTYYFTNEIDTYKESGSTVSTIIARWDENIYEQYENICRTQTQQKYSLRPWAVQETSEETTHEVSTIYNMGYENLHLCIHTTTDNLGTLSAYLVYCLQNPGTDWQFNPETYNIDTFKYKTSSPPSSDLYNIISVPERTGLSTTIDEFLNFYGYMKPLPRNETPEINTDQYIGGPSVQLRKATDPGGAEENYWAWDSYNYQWVSIPHVSEDGKPTGEFIGDMSYYNGYKQGQRASGALWDGLIYYYKLNKFSLYVRNVYGLEADYHYDFVASIADADYRKQSFKADEDGIQYSLPINHEKFVIQNDEKGDIGQDGVTGIKKSLGQFLNYVPGTGNNGINDRPPVNVDQHYIFGGWFDDKDTTDESHRVTKYYFDEAQNKWVHTATWEGHDTAWTMPNHQQDLYASWFAPNRKIMFNVVSADSSTNEEGLPEHEYTPEALVTEQYNAKINTGAFPTNEEIEQMKSAHPGYRYVGYYYYATEYDKNHNIQTWFDPTRMEMPWVDWAEKYDTTTGEPIIQVHQYWEQDTYVSYEVRFVLDVTDNEEYLVADSMTGRGKVGDHITVSYLDPVNQKEAFKVAYRGAIVFNEEESQKTKPIDLHQPTVENPNLVVFHYKYDSQKVFKYRINEYLHDRDAAEGVWYTLGQGDVQITENYENWKIVEPAMHPSKVREGKVVEAYTSVSPEILTVYLSPSDASSPDEGVTDINIYYTEANPIVFNFGVITLNSDGTERTDSVIGGSVSANRWEDYPFRAASSTASMNEGFYLKGWYYENKSTKVEDKWLSEDKLTMTCPWDTGEIYEVGRTYYAIFQEYSSVTLKYTAKTVKSDTDFSDVSGYTCGLVTGSSETLSKGIWDSPQTLMGSGVTTSGGHFIGWYLINGDAFTLVSSDENFIPQPVQLSGKYAYSSHEYFALFTEDPIDILFKVKAGQESIGSVNLSKTSVRPHEDTTAGTSTAVVDSPFYHWLKWTDEAGTTVATTEAFTPAKQDGVFVAKTYFANFELNTERFTVKFETDGNGVIENDDEFQVLDGASVNVNGTNAIVFNDYNAEHPNAIPVADEGFEFDRWTVLNQVEDEFPLDSEHLSIKNDVTYKAYFKPIAVPPTPDPDNPVIVNAQTGDSNLGLIIGLIAIILVAGGVTYVVARKRKSYKPKHK